MLPPFLKNASEGIIDLRPSVIVDAVSLEITNTSNGTAPAADLVLSMYVGQLKRSRLDVASMNTNSEDCWMYLWARYIMGLQISSISGFPSSESLLPLNC